MRTPSRQLRDGDIITVDPAAMALLTIPTGKAEEAPKVEEVKAAEPAELATEVTGDAAVPEAASAEGATKDMKEARQPKKVAFNRKNWNSHGLHESPTSKHTWMKETGKPLNFQEVHFMGPWTFVPEYLEVNYNICSAVFLRAPTLHPGRCELPTPHPPEMHALAFEWYSRIYNRKTKRAPPEPTVVHGQPVKLKEKFRKIVESEAKARTALFARAAAEAERERILETGAAMIRPPGSSQQPSL